MKRVIGATLLVGLLPGLAVAASPAQPRLTKCFASTFVQAGRGVALFKGNCNGKDTTLKADSSGIKGRVGGLVTVINASGANYTGRIGHSKFSLKWHGATMTGRYGASTLRFGVVGSTVIGRVGSARITCSIKPLPPLGELITCTGAHGGAHVLVPFLTKVYAAP